MKHFTTGSYFYLALALSVGGIAYARLDRLKHFAKDTVEKPAHEDNSSSVRGREYFTNGYLNREDGKSLHIFDDLLQGKVVLVNFIFTKCQAYCPLETARLRKVYDQLKDRMGKDIFFYSISIDPENDTPKVLAAYKERFKIGDGWHFFTGDKKLVDDLQLKLGILLDESDKQNKLDHSLNVIIGNQSTGQWLKRSHLENPAIMATLIEQLHQRQAESSKLPDYSAAPTSIEPVTQGERIFVSRCADCHSIGEGDSLGPDLYEISAKRDPVWLDRWLENPGKMIADKDPIALALFRQFNQIEMPNLKLSPGERKSVLEFIQQQSQKKQVKGLKK